MRACPVLSNACNSNAKLSNGKNASSRLTDGQYARCSLTNSDEQANGELTDCDNTGCGLTNRNNTYGLLPDSDHSSCRRDLACFRRSPPRDVDQWPASESGMGSEFRIHSTTRVRIAPPSAETSFGSLVINLGVEQVCHTG